MNNTARAPTSNNGSSVAASTPASAPSPFLAALQQQPLQQQQGGDNQMSAMQQAIQNFQASVDAAAQQQSNPQQPSLTSSTPQAPATLMPQLQQSLFPALASTGIPTPQQQQLIWQQAWLAMAQQQPQAAAAAAALSQPYFAAAAAAAMNPLQTQLRSPQLGNAQPATVASAAAAVPVLSSPSQPHKKRKAESSSEGSKRSSKKGVPSVVSNNSSSKFDDDKPPVEKSEAELARMSASDRRRYERNLREQQRSYKISQQIKSLRDVLQESNIPFRPNKYSILVSVAEYIKQLQGRAIMVDSEHQRLIKTIRHTKEHVVSSKTSTNNTSSAEQPILETDALLVDGIDLQAVFHNCPYPLGVASLDGRVLACNQKMEEMLRIPVRNGMMDQSFFVFIRNHQEIFEAMAALLKRSTLTLEEETAAATAGKKPQRQLLFWCGHILSQHNETFPFTITLTNNENDNPKFFSLSATRSGPG